MILALGRPNSYKHNDILLKIPPAIKNEIPRIELPEIRPKDYLQKIKSIPNINIISIGISTGGPNALRNILPVFPSHFPVPIVIVQHMPAGFTYEFAKSLNNVCQLEVKEAEENDIIKPGRILIAPGDKHLTFIKKKLGVVVKLEDTPPINGHKPSVDVLFESTANIFGENSIGCIMTGMGKDGANKIGMILHNGGITIAQNQSTSIVFGMPKNAIEIGNIQIVSSLEEIPKIIMQIVEKTYKI
jgi:two-component system chemotaxis response regulator CheB